MLPTRRAGRSPSSTDCQRGSYSSIRAGDERQALRTCGDADDLFFDAARYRIYVACGEGQVDVFEVRKGFAHLAQVASRSGARTGPWAPELDLLFVAARAQRGDAAILVFGPR
jgi:hypothetical protein